MACAAVPSKTVGVKLWHKTFLNPDPSRAGRTLLSVSDSMLKDGLIPTIDYESGLFCMVNDSCSPTTIFAGFG
jgi:hypothetical protein